MTSAMIYSVRFAEKLTLPKLILENISKLRLVPAAYRPIRPVKKMSKQTEDNWRSKLLVDMVRRVRETDDPQYDEILSIFNKIAPPTLDKLSGEALVILKGRDKEFCLRVTTLLFDKAIKQSFYAGLMADLAQRINGQIPEISEDLETHAQMFTSLYDMTETLLFPKIEDPEFKDKVILWAKQKDVRRGYARFLTHLFTRDLITGRALQESMQKVFEDLQNTIVEPKSEQSEENVTQFADFIFEIAKLLKPSAIELRGLISTKLGEILGRPRPDLPSLNMRSRFKLEDAVKCVQKV
jgi:hypothetical protein